MGHLKKKRRKAAKSAPPRIVEKFHFVGFGQTFRRNAPPTAKKRWFSGVSGSI